MIPIFLLVMILAVPYPHVFAVEPAQPLFGARDTRLPFDALRQPDAAIDPNELLPPDEAFHLSVVVTDARTIVAELTPAKGYYLYRDKFVFRVQDSPDIDVASVELPRAEIKDDPFFGKTEVFRKNVQAVIRLRRPDTRALTVTLHVEYQGCNDPIGVCYSPIEKRLRLQLPALSRAR